MNIDRHNYEECFILYWDNELTALQKQAVENFVKENADLQEEFNILGQTRFTPDSNIQLEKKEFLLNNSFINITNYEEQLLNYIDDEVTDGQRKEVERFAGQYSAVKQELALLQKTKLQPEAEIIFPDKTILYRREEKVRVISMTWFRVAVAAAIILIAGFATFRLVNNNDGTKIEIVKGGDENQPQNKPIDQPLTPSIDQPQKDREESFVNAGERSPKKEPTDKKDIKKPLDKNDDPKPLIAQRENKNKLPNEGKAANQTTDPNVNPDEAIVFSKDNDKAEKSGPDKKDPNVTLQAGYALNIQEPGKTLIPEERESGGIKEFLRKTTRVFERRTKIQTTTDDNKLLVGVFAVSLK
jgi:hypothetical protein